MVLEVTDFAFKFLPLSVCCNGIFPIFRMRGLVKIKLILMQWLIIWLLHILWEAKLNTTMTRIKRLIELLSPYSFNLYYIKGKHMVLSDFLSRQKMEDNNPHEIIPIPFTLKSLAHNHFYQLNRTNEISETETNKYLIQTRSQAKSNGIKVPEIHGVNKGINPHIKPGRQRPLPTLLMHSITPTTLAKPVDKGLPTNPIPKPRIGQGRAGLKRKIRTNQSIPLPKWMLAQPVQTPAPKEVLSLPEPTVQSQENVQPQHHVPNTINPTSTGRSYMYHTTNWSKKYSINHLHPTWICKQDLHQDLLM